MVLLSQKNIDVLITALEFRNESGLDLIGKMNQSGFGNIHKAILTGRDTIELRRQADGLGVEDYIPKDISLGSLSLYFERLMSRKKIASRLGQVAVGVFSRSASTVGQIRDIFTRRGILQPEYIVDLEDLKKNSSHLSMIFLDLDGMEEDGNNLLIELRASNMGSTLIVLCSESDPEVISELLLSGADEYLPKPFGEKLLMARINASVRIQTNMGEIREQKEALERANLELKRLVITDGLTQIYNRLYLMQCIHHEMERSQRYGRNLSLAMFDIDKFKNINDTYGHQGGDAVLVEVAACIRNSVRNCDIVGRYGGEEFMVILPEIDPAGAVRTAERIRANIEKTVIGVDGISVTISGGVCSVKDQTVESLIRQADQLLYQAKRNGRNRVEFVLESIGTRESVYIDRM